FVIGNAITRENPLLESILDSGRRYTSGPQWLAENVLREKWVLAVAGTHGKTTTTALLAWILDQAGLDPGFLIGGVAIDFGVSARLADGPFFVIEADEYDTAFSDKRSKFVHYRPRTAILTNLEYDHPDIFPDLAAIAAARHVSVPVRESLAALATFRGVKRRMELRGTIGGIAVYDDFAHHPTAIAATLEGLRREVGKARILAVLEPRSSTMKRGTMKDALAGSLEAADLVFCYAANLSWDAAAWLQPLGERVQTSA